MTFETTSQVFHVRLSKYQSERLVMESGHVHEEAEQIIREALAKYWGDMDKRVHVTKVRQ